MVDITTAKTNTDDLYKNLSEIVDEIVNKQCKTLDGAIKKLSKIDILSNEEIRKLMITTSVEAYTLSTFKEQSSLKDACATALYKEGIATSYNNLTGTVESRKNQSAKDNLDKQVVAILYTNVCDRLKAKVDEAHRITNVLSNVLISRASDAKLQYNPRSEEDRLISIDPETGEIF